MSRKCRFLLNVKVKKIKYMKNLHFRLFLFIIILGPSTPYGRDERDIQSEE